jgi:adhesin/invasin
MNLKSKPVSLLGIRQIRRNMAASHLGGTLARGLGVGPLMFMKLHRGSGAGNRVQRRLFAFVTAVTLVAPLLLAGAFPVAAYSTADPTKSTIVVDNGTPTVDDTVHITVTLNDSNGDPVGATDGTVALSSDLGLVGAVTPVGDGTYTADLNSQSPGTATITGTLDGDPITASDPVTVDFAVGAASPYHTLITADAGPFTVDSPSAGLTVQLRDQYGNDLTGSGGTVDLSPSIGNASITPLTDNGDGTWSATLNLVDDPLTAGVDEAHVPNQVVVSGTLNDAAITDTETVDFLPGALDHFTIDTVGNQTAGTSFSPTFRAFDQYNNPKTDYDGGASALSGLAASPGCAGCNDPIPAATPEYGTLSWSDGVASPTVTAYAADGTSSITITDSPISKASDDFVVAHAATLTGFTFDSISNSTAGDTFDVTVRAYDAYGNPKTDQNTGTLSGLNPSPGCVITICNPAIPVATPDNGNPLDWTAGDGTGTTSVTPYEARDDATLKIKDGSVENTASWDEGPASLGGFSIDTIGNAVAGADITVKVTAYDTYGNVKDNYTGSSTLSGLGSSPGCANCSPAILASGPDYGTLVWANGVGTATIHAYLTGSSSVSYSEGGFSATSNSFNVTEAALGGFTIGSISNQTASSTGFTVTANAYDLYGNAKTGYNAGTLSGTLGTSPTCSTCLNGGTAPTYGTGGSLSWLNGVGTATVKAHKAETGRTVTITDGSVSRTSNTFDVGFAAVSVLDFSIGALETDAQAGFNGQPNTTKKGTPIYHICALPGSGTDPCNTASPPVQVLARDRFGNVTSGVAVGLTATQALSGSPSATTNGSGIASFTGPAPIVANAATTGTVFLTASATGGVSRDSLTFQLVDDLEACANATCDNLATSGQTSYGRIDASGGVSGFAPVSGGLLDGVSLVTQFQPASAFCGQNTAQVGRTTDVHVEALGGVPTLNFKVGLIIPKSLLQSSGYASRNASTFNVCFGATYLGTGSPSPLWQAKTSPTNTTLINSVFNSGNGLYWGWLPDCSTGGKKSPPALSSENPCIVLRTKNAKELQTALGLSNAQFATLHFGSGDLGIVYQTRTPWDAKGSIF